MRTLSCTTLAALTAASLALTASSAHAEGLSSRLGVGLEVGGAHTIDPYNNDLFGLGVGGSLHLEINVHPLLGIHVGGALAWLSANQSESSATWFGGRAGLRFHWGYLLNRYSLNDGWLDAHYAYGVSGSVARSGFDVGLGYEIGLAHQFRIGPYARLQWASDPREQNPMVLLVGVSVGLFGDRADVPDTDRDGVLDPDDLCPSEPQGAEPDPQRRGCPARDSDGDNVIDPLDACPTVPAGAHPDPARRGCPARDTDSDGVMDPQDLCPTVPAGAHPDPARAGCPATDQDNDGVFDAEDQCPTTPQGARPDPTRRGCPVGDRDGDTVLDDVDHCPDQPGAPSTDPARNGCPGLVRIEASQIRILRPVFFATNRDVILEESYPVLTAVGDAIHAVGIQHVRVEGHTDNRGNARHNLSLSQRRAESVRRWLIGHGLAEGSVVAQGFGDQHPVETNATELGRAANRRVEFHIVDNEPAAPASAPTAPPAHAPNVRPHQGHHRAVRH